MRTFLKMVMLSSDGSTKPHSAGASGRNVSFSIDRNFHCNYFATSDTMKGLDEIHTSLC
jgi:hypothetical protein